LNVLSSPYGHYDIWNHFILNSFPILKNKEYDDFPRGRVNLVLSRPMTAIILASQYILKNLKLLNKIQKATNITKLKKQLLPDDHYL
jgi:hypothetical protein